MQKFIKLKLSFKKLKNLELRLKQRIKSYTILF